MIAHLKSEGLQLDKMNPTEAMTYNHLGVIAFAERTKDGAEV